MVEKKLSLQEIRSKIDMEHLPRHIGIIMDGNGRWANRKLLPRTYGHQEGMKRVVEIVTLANNLGIESLSLYAFSTENWKRPKDEVNGLMKILVLFINNELDKLHNNNVKLKIMGDIQKLPEFAKKEVIRAIEKTFKNTGMILNIGLNYGGRDEIVYGLKKVYNDIDRGKITLDDVTVDSFKNYLYTEGQADLDLLIRPSGELRLSNFMLYQVAYSELYFSNILWPDFRDENFLLAIVDYQSRNRRFGGI